MITGAPLLQEVDLELPFGGAVFRHVRTFSEVPRLGQGVTTYSIPYDRDAWWDWHGIGWMIGENPILLIDAGYADIVSTGRRRCYFLPDAHRAIPFDFDPINGEYVAPPRFDARMAHNGVWIPGDPGCEPLPPARYCGHWQTRPTTFWIWMYGGSVRYQIDAVMTSIGGAIEFEDVPRVLQDAENDPNATYVSANVFPALSTPEAHLGHTYVPPYDVPFPMVQKAGWGVPGFGLVKEIEDRNGNRVVIDYCVRGQSNLDIPTTPCLDCLQRCTEKGQVRTVKLYPGGQSGPPAAAWTLVYVHRSFWDLLRGELAGGDPYSTISGSQWYKQNALAAIVVYEGDRSINQPCLTIDGDLFIRRVRDFDHQDSLDLVQAAGLDNDWLHLVKYTYSEPRPRPETLPADFRVPEELSPDQHVLSHGLGSHPENVDPNPRLLRAFRIDRASASSQAASSLRELGLYRYQEYPTGSEVRKNATLKAAYRGPTVEQIVEAIRTDPENPAPNATANVIMDLPDNEPIRFRDVVKGDYAEHFLGALPDVAITTAPYSENSPLFGSAFLGHILSNYVQSNVSHADLGSHDGVTRLSRRNGAAEDNGFYRIYRLIRQDDTSLHWPGRNIYHEPYRWRSMAYRPSASSPIEVPATPMTEPVWVIIIDRYDEEGQVPVGIPTPPQSSGVPSGDPAWNNVRSRRIVELNAAGYILNERTWTFDNGVPQLAGASGARDEYEFDEYHRIVKHRTAGWSVAALDPNIGGDERGLVIKYDYDGDIIETRPESQPPRIIYLAKEPATMTVQEGDDEGVPSRITLNREFNEDRPDLIELEQRFPEDGRVEETRFRYTLEEVTPQPPVGTPPEARWRVAAKTTIGAPAPARHGGPALRPYEKIAYTATGQQEWRGYGLLQWDMVSPEPSAPSQPDERYYLDYKRYDDRGRAVAEGEDVVAGAPVPDQDPVPVPPTSLLARFDPNTAALNRIKAKVYENGAHGLSRVNNPDGTVTFYLYASLGHRTIQRVYSDWVYRHTDQGVDHYTPSAAGTINEFDGATLRKSMRVAWTYASTLPTPDGNEEYVVQAHTTVEYDANGRPIQVEQGDGANGPPITVSAVPDQWGEYSRERAPSGTLTRMVRDQLGRVTHVLRGTKDRHAYWGTLGNSTADDNMILVEKRRYGTGVDDLHRLVEVRRYREGPLVTTSNLADPNFDQDDNGWIETYEYDHRGHRAVVHQPVSQVTASGTTETGGTCTVTYHDIRERPRLVAVFGTLSPTLPTGVDPRIRPIVLDTPAASELLGLNSPSLPLLSLTETIYNLRGQVEATRRYNVSDPSGNDYQLSETYYDHAGRTLCTREPNGPTRYFAYDAQGRQVSVRQVVSVQSQDVEVARTDTTYDDKGNAVRVVNSEWVTGTQSPRQYVRSMVFNWYDDNQRLVATADIGTHTADTSQLTQPDTFTVVSTDAPQRPGQPTWNAVSHTFDLPNGALLAAAKITLYAYDKAGRRSQTILPNRTIKRDVYDGLGRVTQTIELAYAENAGPTDPPVPLRRTGYQYDLAGRLVKMAAVKTEHNAPDFPALPGSPDAPATYAPIDWAAADGTLQVTQMVYGASVAEQDPEGAGLGSVMSLNHDYIASVHFPDPSGLGQPRTQADLSFYYYVDGLLAMRTDEVSKQFKHFYDERGDRNLTDITDQFSYGPNDVPPKDRDNRIILEHDGLGRLTRVTARTHSSEEGPAIVAQSQFAYDGRGNLLSEYQSHGLVVGAATPEVAYGWDSSPASAGNYNRLASMSYPEFLGGFGRRMVGFEYGTSGGVDDRLSRITAIVDQAAGRLAEYGYGGVSRRVSTRLGVNTGGQALLAQDYAAGNPQDVHGFSGLDRFGRPKTVEWKGRDGSTVHRYGYGYDSMDNRLFARVKRVNHNNDRSWLYGYDALDRLVGADTGALDTENDALLTSVPRQESRWTMDSLGNWSGQPSGPSGLEVRGFDAQNQEDWLLGFNHLTDAQNRLTALELIEGTGGQPDTVEMVYGRSGNLVADADYYYQYDAFNRLLQVNERGSLTFTDGYIVAGVQGPWVLHCTYDGLGRLIRTQSPLNTARTQVQAKDFYYDGVRRVCEMWTGPIGSIGPQGISAAPGNPPIGEGIDREYVWGASAQSGVDELVCQFGPSQQPLYAIQDVANSSVLGLVDEGGSGTTRVVAQFQYDAYGEVLAREELGTHADCAVGFQGLFFDRLDAVPGTTVPTVASGALGLCYNRNRSYSPVLGRFMQRDPNGAGVPLAALTHHGRSSTRGPLQFDVRATYGDGMGSYAYCSSNPIARMDSAGTNDFSVPGVTTNMSVMQTGASMSADAVGGFMYTSAATAGESGFSIALGGGSSMLPGMGLMGTTTTGTATGASRVIVILTGGAILATSSGVLTAGGWGKEPPGGSNPGDWYRNDPRYPQDVYKFAHYACGLDSPFVSTRVEPANNIDLVRIGFIQKWYCRTSDGTQFNVLFNPFTGDFFDGHEAGQD